MNIELPPDLIRRTEDEYLNWMEKFKNAFGYHNIPNIKITYLGRVAGRAYYSENTIKLNPYFIQNNTEDFFKQTIPHEIAHFITDWRHPYAKRHHGPEWKRIMVIMGLPPRRCHNYQSNLMPGVHPRPYHYRCVCKSFYLTKRMHNSIVNGKNRQCPHCKSIVVFVDMVNPVK